MNAPLNSDSTLYTASERAGISAPSGYSPSVPISVYRELAAELKTTQKTVESLTKQNQQLVRQNKLLRTEIHRFVEAAEQLGHFAGVMPQQPPTARQEFVSPKGGVEPSAKSSQEPPAQIPTMPTQEEIFVPDSIKPLQKGEIVPQSKEHKRDRSKLPALEPVKQRLFTEQPEGIRPFSKASGRPDLGNLWLVTTILLVVMTAFGAGFLIMRPLLSR